MMCASLGGVCRWLFRWFRKWLKISGQHISARNEEKGGITAKWLIYKRLGRKYTNAKEQTQESRAGRRAGGAGVAGVVARLQQGGHGCGGIGGVGACVLYRYECGRQAGGLEVWPCVVGAGWAGRGCAWAWGRGWAGGQHDRRRRPQKTGRLWGETQIFGFNGF